MWKSDQIVGLEIFNSNLPVSGLTSNLKVNNTGKIYFNGAQAPDTFEYNFYTKLFTEQQIRRMIAANPELQKLLSKNNIKLKLNLEELETLRLNHCRDVAETASAITKSLPPALKQRVNIKTLKEAALLHDFGKVLIPAEILNKPAQLTGTEREIMNLHSELGYQLLKTTGIPDNILNLVRYHHYNAVIPRNFVPDINLQILNLADKYSALTENRVYKQKYSPKQALVILYKEVQEGNIHPLLYQALVNSVSQSKTTHTVTKY